MNARNSNFSEYFFANSWYGDFTSVGAGCEIRMVLIFKAVVLGVEQR